MNLGTLHPLSLFYRGRAHLIQLLEDRLMECSRQAAYWARQYAKHGDDEAFAARDGAMRAHAATFDRLQHIHDQPDCYPTESRHPMDITA